MEVKLRLMLVAEGRLNIASALDREHYSTCRIVLGIFRQNMFFKRSFVKG